VVYRGRILLLHSAPFRMGSCWGWMGYLVSSTRLHGTYQGMTFAAWLSVSRPFTWGVTKSLRNCLLNSMLHEAGAKRKCFLEAGTPKRHFPKI